MQEQEITLRQRILRIFYPLLLLFGKLRQKMIRGKIAEPSLSFHSLSVQLNNGQLLSFEQLKGKKVLLVNTASDCGYTHQYAQLQELYNQSRGSLEIIGFPANDFKEQEKGSDEDIAKFCQVNYGISFPLAKKSSVVPGPDQHPVFDWLTHSNKNGWNDKAPEWNFSKYLIDENGRLLYYFPPAVAPTDAPVKLAVGTLASPL